MDLTLHLDPGSINTIRAGGYVLMGVLMVIEGPLVTLIASFLASLGVFSFSTVLLLGWLGDITGDLLCFYIGRFSLRIFRKSEKGVDGKNSRFLIKLENLVHSNLFLSIFMVKFTPYIQPIGLMFIGKTDIEHWRYLLYSMILCIPTPFVFGMVGYHLGRVNVLLQNSNKESIVLGLIGAITVLLICAVFGYYLIMKSKKALNLHLGEKI